MEAALIEYLKHPEKTGGCGSCKYINSQIPVYVFYGGKIQDKKYFIGYCPRQKEHMENYKICSKFRK